MFNEDDSVAITFNGEIFNYLELGAELRERGHRVRTSSDTEVIVHAWEEWGADCFSRFNGQWAIGIWDRRRRRLTLARDRLGVRVFRPYVVLVINDNPYGLMFALRYSCRSGP